LENQLLGTPNKNLPLPVGVVFISNGTALAYDKASLAPGKLVLSYEETALPYNEELPTPDGRGPPGIKAVL
jgi:hypothetical protein